MEIPSFATYPSLGGRTAFVTGGASGIGADIVRALAANRCKVAFVDIQDAAGQALADELGALYLHCDVTDVAALTAAIDLTRATLGPIGILVNNAANDDRRLPGEVTEGYWDASMAINLRPQFFAAQAVAPQMKTLGAGSIINLSSITWRYGPENMAVYASAKAGIIGLTHALARAYGSDNIRVNAVEPGAVMTERQRALWYPGQADVDAMVAKQMIRRVLTGADVARVVLFLAADDSAMLTRQSIVIDAGIQL